jgi:hypothetical protein
VMSLEYFPSFSSLSVCVDVMVDIYFFWNHWGII